MNAPGDAIDNDGLEPDLPPPRRAKKSSNPPEPDHVLTPDQAKLQDELAEFRKLNEELFGHVKMSFSIGQRMGEMLAGFKKKAGHGNWLKWLSKHLPEVSERSAQVYVSLWENRAVLDKYVAAADLTLKDACRLLGNGGKPKAKRKRATKAAPPETEQEPPASEESPEPAEPSTSSEEAQPLPTEPTKAATAFLTDLFANVGHLDDKRKLADHIADLLHALVGEEATGDVDEPETPKVARGLKFCRISDAVENCRDALQTIQSELEIWADSIPESMENKRESATDAASEVENSVGGLDGLDLPGSAFAALPSLLSSGSRPSRLARIAEILTRVAEALPECDSRNTLEEVTAALSNVGL